MKNIEAFGIIGGDKRQLAAAQAIKSEGYTVHVSGFEKIKDEVSCFGGTMPHEECVLCSDVIIFPLPLTKDNMTLNTPFSEKRIYLNEEFARLFRGKLVFCPSKDKLVKTGRYWQEAKVYDFLNREEMQVCNAVPTAEGE